eukprot:1544660-Pyramimonas_sp.AAC.1
MGRKRTKSRIADSARRPRFLQGPSGRDEPDRCQSWRVGAAQNCARHRARSEGRKERKEGNDSKSFGNRRQSSC